MPGISSGVPATSLPAAGSYSGQAWVDALCADLIAESTPILVARTLDFRPRCLFLSGSAAMGEAIGVAHPEFGRAADGSPRATGVLLSDLDLSLVTGTPVPGPIRQELQPALDVAAERVLARHGVIYGGRLGAGPVGVGLLDAAALWRHPPTFGIVDALRAHRPLWGSWEPLAKIPVPALAALPAYEAWRLVGNRAIERLDAEVACRGTKEAPAERYLERLRVQAARAKLATGLWTARLALRGEYAASWAARSRLLDRALLAEPHSSAVRCAAAFRSFLERPEEPDGFAAVGSERGRSDDEAESGPRALLTEALAEWLEEARRAATEPLPVALPEVGFLRDPVRLRDRYRLWRWDLGDEGARGIRGRLRGGRALISPAGGTPDGRRMAAAALYWRLFGNAPIGRAVDLAGRDRELIGLWGAGSRRFLGRELPVEPGLGERLCDLICRRLQD